MAENEEDETPFESIDFIHADSETGSPEVAGSDVVDCEVNPGSCTASRRLPAHRVAAAWPRRASIGIVRVADRAGGIF